MNYYKIHPASITTAWFCSKRVHTIHWPAKSVALLLINNIWSVWKSIQQKILIPLELESYIKQQLDNNYLQNLQQLVSSVVKHATVPIIFKSIATIQFKFIFVCHYNWYIFLHLLYLHCILWKYLYLWDSRFSHESDFRCPSLSWGKKIHLKNHCILVSLPFSSCRKGVQ